MVLHNFPFFKTLLLPTNLLNLDKGFVNNFIEFHVRFIIFIFLSIFIVFKLLIRMNCVWVYHGVQTKWDTYLRVKVFAWFEPPSQKISWTNAALFNSPFKGHLNQEWNWAWHPPEGCHALLTEKAILVQELVWNLS